MSEPIDIRLIEGRQRAEDIRRWQRRSNTRRTRPRKLFHQITRRHYLGGFVAQGNARVMGAIIEDWSEMKTFNPRMVNTSLPERRPSIVPPTRHQNALTIRSGVLVSRPPCAPTVGTLAQVPRHPRPAARFRRVRASLAHSHGRTIPI